MNPTPDQWMSIIRWVLTLVGGILVGRGLMEAPAVAKLSDAIINAIPVISAFIAGITPLVSLVWGIIKHSQASKVADAKALPPAAKVEVAQTLPSLDKLEVAATLPDSSKLRLVEDMPDIKAIVAKPTASDGVAAAVKDSSRPKVVSAPLAA